MLKYDKIQMEMLKDAYKGNRWTSCIDEKSGNVYVIPPKRDRIYVVPKCFWLLNNEAFNYSEMGKKVCDELQKNIYEYEDAHLTGVSREVKPDKKAFTILELKNSKGNRVWVKKEYLKYFENTTFKVNGPKDVVCVFDDTLKEFIGCVCPVYVKEDE